MSVSTVAIVLFSGALGGAVGVFVDWLVSWLPARLEQQWRGEAREVLGLPEESSAMVSYAYSAKKSTAITALFCALISAYIAWHFGFGWQSAGLTVLSWGLLAMGLIDAKHQLLPDVLVLPLLWLGLIFNSYSLFATLSDALFGAVIGYLSLFSVFLFFKIFTGNESLGYGDFKLFALLGAWGGWQMLLPTLLLASCAAMLVNCRAKRSVHIAFGPYLAIAGFAALLFWQENYFWRNIV